MHTGVKWLLLILNILALVISLPLMILSASVVYFPKTPILLIYSRIPVFILCMEVRKKYNISVRKLFGKMSEPGERNEGGGPGKLSRITSNINMLFASKLKVPYLSLAEYSCVYPVLNLVICYTIVQYSNGPSFDLCLVIFLIALWLVMTSLAVTISNCSSRYGE
jgi:hypothetical protein